MRHLDRTLDTLKGMAPTTPPPDTCPLIDGVLKNICFALHAITELRLQAINSTEPMDNQKLGEDLAFAIQQLEPLNDTMEAIRHHNARLRNLSLFWYRAAKQMHGEGHSKKKARSAFKAGYKVGVQCDKRYDADTEFGLWWEKSV